MAVLCVLCPSAFAQPTPGADVRGTVPSAGQGSAAPAAETDLVLAESSETANGGNRNALSDSAWPYFLRMLLTLAFVLGAIWLTFRFLRKAGRPRIAEDAFVKVLASVPLGTGRWLYVVSLGAKAFLIGATDSSLNLIHEVEDPELIDEMKLWAATAPQADTRDFGTLLSGLLKPVSKHRADSAKGIPGTEFLARQRDRLKRF